MKIYSRLIEYIDDNNIINPNQFGFRHKHSTCLALLKFVDEITKSIDERKITVGIFIDLAKAFDTVNHSILVNKLNHYGIRGVANKWFVSYLSNRQQYVSINNKMSKFSGIVCGIPQGSILGPLLFLIYINDLNFASNKLKNIMFADDTNLFLTGKNMDQIEVELNSELVAISDWFQANLLSLNVKKTSYMIFTNRKNLSCQIHMLGTVLNRASDSRFLGVIVSHNLKWNKHIDLVISKISKSIGIVSKLRHLLPQTLTRSLYLTMVEPYLNYCCIIWAGSEKTVMLEKILKIQKKYCRIITFSKFIAPSKPLFISLHLLDIYNIYAHQLAVHMFIHLHNMLPSHLLLHFPTHESMHNYNTRRKADLRTVYCRTALRHNSFLVSGPKYWNQLPTSIKNSPSVRVFKKRFKLFLLSKA
ncbi:MAG: reverse transcriptase family protein [Oscillospiraceae bacterium]